MQIVPWAFTDAVLTYLTILAVSVGVCILAMKL